MFRLTALIVILAACNDGASTPAPQDGSFAACAGDYTISLDGQTGSFTLATDGDVQGDVGDDRIYATANFTSGSVTSPNFFGEEHVYLVGQLEDDCTLTGNWDRDDQSGSFTAVPVE